jgi:1-deoxyxylulose-5-phosphate synthase
MTLSGSSFRPRRELGKTGFCATVLGIGDLADRRLPSETCVSTLHRAMDAGLNLIDTAPSYEDGYSEEVVGKALRGRREGLFVIDKVDHLDRPVAPQIDGSLCRLGLDAVDLFVFHGVSKTEDWETLGKPGGGRAQLDACVKAGKARFKGISSHHPDVLTAALKSGWCDVVLFPIGPFVDSRYAGEILPLARQLKVGTVCFKTFGAGKLVDDTTGYNQPLPGATRGLPRLAPAECVLYTLTCDPDVALLGLSFPKEQDEAFAAARDFKPLPPAAMEEIRQRATAAIAGKGKCWWNP